ncbi:MAG TPA: hypothetical protein ENI23_04555 [bacterium]|nr:hypothetical protein [bacterium]
MIRTCKICHRNYEYSRKKGHQLSKCNSCKSNIRRYNIKHKIVEYLGGKCINCGYNKCLGALQAHYIKDKKFSMAGNHSRSWEIIKKELDKCILLCGNCHSEKHHNCKQYNC